MKVTQVTFTRTKQVNRYEPERIELTIELNGRGDTVAKAVAHARATIAREFGEKPKATCLKKRVDYHVEQLEVLREQQSALGEGFA